MKIFFSFLCILMLASCGSENKNRTSNTDTNNTNTGGSQSGAADNGPANTAFGVFIYNMPQNAKLAALKNIGALYTRLSLRADKPDEISDAYSKLYQQGYKIFLNVQWGSVKQEDGSQEAQPFPTDMVDYEKKLRRLLDNLKSQPPFVIVVGREPSNLVYHTGDMSEYITQLRVTIRVCHEYGIKVADGGLHPQGLTLWAYQDFLQRGLKDSANYLKNFFTREGRAYLDPSGAAPKIADKAKNYMARVKELLDAYKTLDLDFVNTHIHDPNSFNGNGQTASDYNAMIRFYARYTGKPVISDNFAVSENNPALLKSVMQEVKKSGIKYAIYFSANDRVSFALTDDNGNLTELGKVFKANMN